IHRHRRSLRGRIPAHLGGAEEPGRHARRWLPGDPPLLRGAPVSDRAAALPRRLPAAAGARGHRADARGDAGHRRRGDARARADAPRLPDRGFRRRGRGVPDAPARPGAGAGADAAGLAHAHVPALRMDAPPRKHVLLLPGRAPARRPLGTRLLRGLLFGFGAATLVDKSGYEARALAPAVQEKTTWTQHPSTELARAALDRGDQRAAAEAYRTVLREQPLDREAAVALARIEQDPAPAIPLLQNLAMRGELGQAWIMALELGAAFDPDRLPDKLAYQIAGATE